MRTLGYLGPLGTFSHTAALCYASEYDCEPICCSGLEFIFEQVGSGRLDYGIVPVENSLGGSVGETLDLLSATDNIYVIGELLLQVRQHLLVRPGVTLSEIEKICSHPQALAQCRKFIKEKFSVVPVMETVSTAAAARSVASTTIPWAAISSESAATVYGLETLYADIQDNSDNLTRFLLLGKEKLKVSNSAKTSLVFGLKDCPGALYQILKEFALREINLTRIESRPVGSKLGEYNFFVDLTGRDDEPEVADAISKIKKNALWVKLLGCYQTGASHEHLDANTMVEPTSLAYLRKKIDLVDLEIIQLLTMRQSLVEKVTEFKIGKNEIVDNRREQEIILRIKELARQNNLDNNTVEGIYKLILQSSVRRQKEMIACK